MYPLAIGVSHSFPMIGLQKIQYELQWTIDRMTYMMNYIISRLNNGMHPRDVAWNLENENAFLHGQSGVSPQELYGYPYAAAMGTFVNTLGWYTGSIEELEMVNKTTEAVRIVELMGGMTSVVSKVQKFCKTSLKICQKGQERAQERRRHRRPALRAAARRVRPARVPDQRLGQPRFDKIILRRCVHPPGPPPDQHPQGSFFCKIS